MGSQPAEDRAAACDRGCCCCARTVSGTEQPLVTASLLAATWRRVDDERFGSSSGTGRAQIPQALHELPADGTK